MKYLITLSFIALLIGCSDPEPSPELPEENFTLATITSTAVSELSVNSAVSGGNVINDGGINITARGVVWNTASGPTISDNKTSDGTGTGKFSSTLNDLESNTMYYLRSYAINSEGTAYGNEVSFETLESEPEPQAKVFDGDVVLTTQQEVDDFAAEGYFKITGSLTIKDDNAPSSIVNLEPLNILESIGGSLEIAENMVLTAIKDFSELTGVNELMIHDNNSLEEISGFNNLSTLGGDLSIFDNQSSFTVIGFNSINSISGSLNLNNLFPGEIKEINGFTSLENIDGNLTFGKVMESISTFGELKSISGNLMIQVCRDIEDLTFLNSVSMIGGNLRILKNDALTTLSGLENVVLIKENVFVEGNDSLDSLMGLQNLNRIEGFFLIDGNGLLNLSGLNNIEHIEKGLSIQNNLSLKSLDGLQNLSLINEGGLRINGNDDLTNVDGLSGLIQVGNANLSLVGDIIDLSRNNKLNNVNGLVNLKTAFVTRFMINLNSSLENLDGLSSFNEIVHPDGMSVLVEINNNDVLTDLCGIRPLFDKYFGSGDVFFEIIDSPVGREGFEFNSCN